MKFPSHRRADLFTDEERRQIASEYLAGDLSKTVSKRWGTSPQYIGYCLKRFGFKARSKGFTRRAKGVWGRQAEVIADYEAIMPMRRMEEKYGSCRATILRFVQHVSPASAEKRNGRRSCTVNESVFEGGLEEADFYWLGFLMADGCVSDTHHSPTIRVNLQLRDIGHIEDLRRFFGSTHKLIYGSCRLKNGVLYKNVGFSISSRRIAKSLKSYGIVPRKSLVAKAKRGIQNCAAFWRGCIDGDGTVKIRDHYRPPRWEIGLFGGSLQLISQFKRFVRKHVASYGGNIVHRKKNYHSLVLTGRAAIALAKVLYGNGGPALERKASVAREMIRRSSENANLFDIRYTLKGRAFSAQHRMRISIGVRNSRSIRAA